jgi:opacity protein-like surface antigen
MQKQFLLAGATVLTLTFAAASAQAATTTQGDMMSNVYVGAYGGYGWNDADLDGGPELDVNGFDYGILAGFQLGSLIPSDTMRFGLNGALEVHYGWSNADETDTVGINPVTVEKDHEWGISFRPGMRFLSDTAPLGLNPYAIVGYRNANFETTTVAGGTDDDNHNGFELGIGSEVLAQESLGMRLDYTHVWFDAGGGIDPSEDDLRLGVTYHF